LRDPRYAGRPLSYAGSHLRRVGTELCLEEHGFAPWVGKGLSMRKKLKFYFNLAIIGFTVGRAYGALHRRLARDLRARRRVWS
jgi:hypothetical protein